MGIGYINLHTKRLLIKSQHKEIEWVVTEQTIWNIKELRHVAFKKWSKIWKKLPAERNQFKKSVNSVVKERNEWVVYLKKKS